MMSSLRFKNLRKKLRKKRMTRNRRKLGSSRLLKKLLQKMSKTELRELQRRNKPNWIKLNSLKSIIKCLTSRRS